MKERAFLSPQQSSVTSEVQPRRVDAKIVSAPAGFWSQLAARFRAWFEVPFGYQDEQGFHYGQQPAPKLAVEATSTRARVLTDRADHVMKHSVVLPVAPGTGPSAEPVAAEKKTGAGHH